jgi:hypothetical protein
MDWSRQRTFFSHPVVLGDWLGHEASTDLNLRNLKYVFSHLLKLPIARKNSITSFKEIATMLLRCASEQERGSDCSTETPAGVRVTVQLKPTYFLEEELLAINVEITDSGEGHYHPVAGHQEPGPYGAVELVVRSMLSWDDVQPTDKSQPKAEQDFGRHNLDNVIMTKKRKNR